MQARFSKRGRTLVLEVVLYERGKRCMRERVWKRVGRDGGGLSGTFVFAETPSLEAIRSCRTKLASPPPIHDPSFFSTSSLFPLLDGMARRLPLLISFPILLTLIFSAAWTFLDDTSLSSLGPHSLWPLFSPSTSPPEVGGLRISEMTRDEYINSSAPL